MTVHDITPPSRNAPWRSSLVWKPPVKIPEQGRIQDKTTRNPGSVLRAIAFPIHQVLETPAPPAHIQQPLDRIGRLVVYE